MNKEEILKITKKFHDTYEKLSKEYDYETRKETRVFDINSSNGKLMYATVNEIVSPILKENKELKQKYENAVADYETTMFEKEQLKKQLTTYQILHRDCNIDNLKNISKIEEKETQQKEFIKYLEDDLKEKYKDMGYRHNIFREILDKYEEIIGDIDDKI